MLCKILLNSYLTRFLNKLLRIYGLSKNNNRKNFFCQTPRNALCIFIVEQLFRKVSKRRYKMPQRIIAKYKNLSPF